MEDQVRLVLDEEEIARLSGDASEQVPSNHEEADTVDEDEDECRVCRGPAEEGRPLYAPCKCSGSIGLTHQDCLVSWLEVTRGDGRCELCKTKFHFDPIYAEGAPDRLPPHEVALGLSSRFLAKWMPFAVRIVGVAFLWLFIAPLLTASLYHLLMYRSYKVIARWKRELILSDVVSGAIIVAIIVVSFLSLMSFADFLRVHWQQDQEPRQRRRDAANQEANEEMEDEVDERLFEHAARHLAQAAAATDLDEQDSMIDTVMDDEFLHDEQRLQEETPAFGGQPINTNNPPIPRFHVVEDVDSGSDEDYYPQQEDDEEEEDNEDDFPEEDDHIVEEPPPRPVQNNDIPFDPLDPALQDDLGENEVVVAFDELLGLRGPPAVLVRNFLWVLAFNAAYLVLFTFVPCSIGSAVFSGFLNTTASDSIIRRLPYVYSEDTNRTTVLSTLEFLNEVSVEKETTFRLPHVSTVILGYLAIGAMIVSLRYGWRLSRKVRRQFSVEGTRIRTNLEADVRMGHWAERRGQRDAPAEVLQEDLGNFVEALLDATVSIVKVGVLLFLKMFLLPLTLGLCLDASTTALMGHTLDDRVQFAGRDLFSFVLLHWVAGISFMLIVTVFLLQLREVAHPELLARVIRPQEPQPDLLGNLMNENVATHTKRIVLSLAIYVPLLLAHITIPVRILVATGVTQLSFFNLNLYHLVMPQLQIPIELVIFHLSTLALLERNKNLIGCLQHNWIKFLCRKMELTEYIMPRSILKFKLVSKKPLLSSSTEKKEVDDFWIKLANATKDSEADELILKHLEATQEIEEDEGTTTRNGNRVLDATFRNIRLPTSQGQQGILLPTVRGSYRLKYSENNDESNPLIEIWQEVPGNEIARPPEGWDDLGDGGAYVQGRWAWGNEKKSTVEGGVAHRLPFRDPVTGERPTKVLLKVLALMGLSWLAIVCTVLSVICFPLAIGRFLFYCFRIPQEYVHDPFALVIGGGVLFPMVSLATKQLKLDEGKLEERFNAWRSRFCFPTRPKMMILFESLALWGFVAPLALGYAYEIVLVKGDGWFDGTESVFDLRSFCSSWLVGLTMLYTWAYCAYFNVFTKEFWSTLGRGMLEPPVDEDGNPVAPRNRDAGREAETGGRSRWQGSTGRVARFVNVWSAVLLDWDWEKVDRDVLVEDFSKPIAKHIASLLVGSSLSYQLSLLLTPLVFRRDQGQLRIPLVGAIALGQFRRRVFQTGMATHLLVQLGSAFHSQLEGWFEAAHSAARDDRYLIGETLTNYEAERQENGH